VLQDMHTRADAPATAAARDELSRLLHAKKNECYADIVSTGLIALRDGVLPLMVQCQARGVRLAIATTTSRANVHALLHHHLGASWAQRFDAIVCGEDVTHKKPDPAVYQQALQLLGIAASQAVAVEDAPAGVAAARAAGVACVVTRSAYFAQAQVGDVLAVGPGLHTRKAWLPAPRGGVSEGGLIDLADIDAWHAGSIARAALR
jgi:HAD superfamily hydrolase (TIGR01509 family)